MTATSSTTPFLSADTFLAHWQGHRRLTRRVIEAFPEEALFTYREGSMRTFADIMLEVIGITASGMPGIATGQWPALEEDGGESKPTSKADLLRLWDEATTVLDTLWPTIAPERFQQREKAFGLYDGHIYESLLYFVDNEIHHRAQGYVYLRALGIEPPGFYER